VSKKPVWTQAKKNRVRKFFAYWLQEFGFLPMNVHIAFREKNETVALCEGFAAVSIKYHYPYRSLEIECFPQTARYNNKKLTEVILHEMIHITLARLKGNRMTEDKKVWERLEEEAADLIGMVMTSHLSELQNRKV
jgi:hypothetical protein